MDWLSAAASVVWACIGVAISVAVFARRHPSFFSRRRDRRPHATDGNPEPDVTREGPVEEGEEWPSFIGRQHVVESNTEYIRHRSHHWPPNAEVLQGTLTTDEDAIQAANDLEMESLESSLRVAQSATQDVIDALQAGRPVTEQDARGEAIRAAVQRAIEEELARNPSPRLAAVDMSRVDTSLLQVRHLVLGLCQHLGIDMPPEVERLTVPESGVGGPPEVQEAFDTSRIGSMIAQARADSMIDRLLEHSRLPDPATIQATTQSLQEGRRERIDRNGNLWGRFTIAAQQPGGTEEAEATQRIVEQAQRDGEPWALAMPETPQSSRDLNAAIFEQLSNPDLSQQAADAVNDFTRTRMREVGFARRIMPPLTITDDELDRSVDSQTATLARQIASDILASQHGSRDEWPEHLEWAARASRYHGIDQEIVHHTLLVMRCEHRGVEARDYWDRAQDYTRQLSQMTPEQYDFFLRDLQSEDILQYDWVAYRLAQLSRRQAHIEARQVNPQAPTTIPHTSLPENVYIRGPRFRVSFDRITLPRFSARFHLAPLREQMLRLKQELEGDGPVVPMMVVNGPYPLVNERGETVGYSDNLPYRVRMRADPPPPVSRPPLPPRPSPLPPPVPVDSLPSINSLLTPPWYEPPGRIPFHTFQTRGMAVGHVGGLARVDFDARAAALQAPATEPLPEAETHNTLAQQGLDQIMQNLGVPPDLMQGAASVGSITQANIQQMLLRMREAQERPQPVPHLYVNPATMREIERWANDPNPADGVLPVAPGSGLQALRASLLGVQLITSDSVPVGEIVEVDPGRRLTPGFQHDVDELRTSVPDIRQILSDNAIRDVLRDMDEGTLTNLRADVDYEERRLRRVDELLASMPDIGQILSDNTVRDTIREMDEGIPTNLRADADYEERRRRYEHGGES